MSFFVARMAQASREIPNLSRFPIDTPFRRFPGPQAGRWSRGTGPRSGGICCTHSEREGTEGKVSRLDDKVFELSLLLPDFQFEALEQEARSRGLTTAQLLRRLVDAFLLQEPT
jgi:hypothetical protein